MDNCLNILERPEVLFSFAALIAIVLLVWAQLWTPRDSGHLDKDLNLVCGLAWTYLAILFTLVASALKVLKIDEWDIGFICLSFLMTVNNILIALFLIGFRILRRNLSFNDSLTGVCIKEPFVKKLPWVLVWLFALFGWGVISFCIAFSCSYYWIGGLLLLIVAWVKALVLLIQARKKPVENSDSLSEICKKVAISAVVACAVVKWFIDLVKKNE